MGLTRFALCLSACLVFSSQIASAAGAPGGGGGGFGGGSGPDVGKLFREGTQLLTDGQCRKAERKFRAVAKAVKRNPEANYLQGVALQCQGKHSAATRVFKKAKRYNDELYVAYEKLGASYLALGEIEDAKRLLADLETKREGCGGECPTKLIQAHANLAAAINQIRNESPSETTNQLPTSGEQQRNERQSRLDLSRPRHKTPSQLKQSLLFTPVSEPQSVYLEAVQLINSARFEEAIVELRRLTSTIGPHPDVLNYLGYAHRRLDRFERAKTYYLQALSIDPLHRGANEYLGEMWVELGQLDKAQHRLAVLDEACPFGCAEYEDLKRAIELRVVAAQ